MITKPQLLRLMRESLNLKQEEVAERASITASYLSLIEHGKKEPSNEVIKKLAQIYNTPSSLFLWNETDLNMSASEEERSILQEMDDYMKKLFFLIMKRNDKNKTKLQVKK